MICSYIPDKDNIMVAEALLGSPKAVFFEIMDGLVLRQSRRWSNSTFFIRNGQVVMWVVNHIEYTKLYFSRDLFEKRMAPFFTQNPPLVNFIRAAIRDHLRLKEVPPYDPRFLLDRSHTDIERDLTHESLTIHFFKDFSPVEEHFYHLDMQLDLKPYAAPKDSRSVD